MKKLKISFDFDGTLNDLKIQKIAKSFIDTGHDVWILTARQCDIAYDENNNIIGYYGYNLDLRIVAERIGLSKNNILYTNGALKKDLFFKHNFDIHYDDQLEEVDAINNNGGYAFLVFGSFSEINDQIQYYKY